MIRVTTKNCIHCGKDGFVEMPYEEFTKGQALYDGGALIQNAFPNLTPDQCEQLITGTHPKCWDEMFAPRCSQHDIPTI